MWHGLFEEAPIRVANKGIIGSRVSSVKFERIECVSKIEMSPLTAKLKCPHGRGKDIHESEAVTEARGDGFG
jgi:hypothetical protein